MQRRLLSLASVLLMIAVALGAFGAHGLRDRITPEALSQWHTGVTYQVIHGLGILALAAMTGSLEERALRWASRAFAIGTLLFSGSLYLLSTRELLGAQGMTPVLGPLTPLGGLLFLGGWARLLYAGVKGS